MAGRREGVLRFRVNPQYLERLDGVSLDAIIILVDDGQHLAAYAPGRDSLFELFLVANTELREIPDCLPLGRPS
jgi:hypothetical protein